MARLNIGSIVSWNDKLWVVQDILDLTRVRLVLQNGIQTRTAPIAELRPDTRPTGREPPAFVPADELARAQKIFEAIQPLTLKSRMSGAEVEEARQKLGCGRATIYAYLKTWESTKRVSAFVRKPRSDKGNSRLDPAVQKIIDQVIEDVYKQEERPGINATVEEVRLRCFQEGLPRPSVTPVRAAILRIPAKEGAKARLGRKHAKERFEPYRGSFPGADYPLAVVQIDHTPADVILVDEQTRKPIGRATLTIVIDVCTRMLMGFCISLEDPGAMNAALALSHAILPKVDWLRSRDIDGEWPIHGIPGKVHADNAKEFRGTALSRGCAEYGITLENRPKGQPQYGGHVERSFRTFMTATQRLKGTTFSNVAKKLNYDSEGKAILTIAEFERWFALFVVFRYHHKKQRGIDHPPIKLYRKLLLGDDTTPPIGLPEPILDTRRLLLDFMPFTMRTVQQDGVAFGVIRYWDDILRPWIRARDLTSPKNARTFVFAYDPRDLSVLYFLDPNTNAYFAIPCRNRAHSHFSIWEVKAAKNWIAQDESRQSNEEMIFRGMAQMRMVEQSAEEKTKKARRTRARRGDWQAAGKAALANRTNGKGGAAVTGAGRAPSPKSPADEDDDGPITPPTFDDI